MEVSVVIPCHAERGWPELVRAVESVRRQSPQPAEIVVAVDHNPALLDRAAGTFGDAKVVPNAYRPGVSGNRNTGVAATTTPLVAMLDGDACARPGWLAGLAAPFADRDVVGTGGAIIPIWRGPRPAWFPDEFLWTVGGSFPVPTRRPTPARNVWSASMAVRRDAFDAVGGFRVGFGKQGGRARPEDTELCLRLAAASGGRWLYVPSAEVEHPVPVDRVRFRAFLTRCYQEGRGKVEMARLLGGQGSLGSEHVYLRRTLPRAVGRGLSAAVHGQGVRHAAAAGATVLGVVAAGVGGGVEALRGPAMPPTWSSAPARPSASSSAQAEARQAEPMGARR